MASRPADLFRKRRWASDTTAEIWFRYLWALGDQALLLCFRLNSLVRGWPRTTTAPALPPMSDLQYRTCQHSGEKVFGGQSRLLTYRGNTYRTRVFQAQQSVNGGSSNVVELFEERRAA